jgi:hypothetical protein
MGRFAARRGAGPRRRGKVRDSKGEDGGVLRALRAVSPLSRNAQGEKRLPACLRLPDKQEPEERGSLRSPSAVNHTVAAKGNLALAPRPTPCPPYACGAFLTRYARRVAPKRSPRAATMLACTASTSPSVRVRSPD